MNLAEFLRTFLSVAILYGIRWEVDRWMARHKKNREYTVQTDILRELREINEHFKPKG